MSYVRPWAVVFSAPTTDGMVWLKVPAPGNVFEAGLYRLLLEEAPRNILKPIASDLESGWLLLPDGGPTVADSFRGAELVEKMTTALPQYAGLQRAMASKTNDMLGLGLFDLGPDSLPEKFERALATMPDTPRSLLEMIPRFEGWCRELAASPLGATVDHNDLHPWNILGLNRNHGTENTAIFYDWGDSVVAYPLGSSVEPISRVRQITGLSSGHQDVLRMRDAYLEVFDDILSRAESVTLIEKAWRVARAARAVVWGATQDDIQNYLDRVHSGELGI